MTALTTATELLGDIELSSGQLAQLRALDRKYAQRLYTLLHDSADGSRRELTEAESAELDTKLRADILSLLTPEQRRRGPSLHPE